MAQLPNISTSMAGKMAWHLYNDEMRPAIKGGMGIWKAIGLTMDTPGGEQIKRFIGLGISGTVSRLLRRGVVTSIIGGSLLFGGKAIASTPMESSSILRGDIDSVESIYDKNPLTRANASNILYETAVHESDLLRYTSQVGGGPAKGIMQMEPDTAKWLVDTWAKSRPRARNLIAKELGITYKQAERLSTAQLGSYLVGNEKFAVAMARLKYASSPGEIPSTIEGRAHYWGKYYQGTNNLVKERKYISDSRTMSEELKSESLGRVMRRHIKPMRPTYGIVQKAHNNKIGHAISSYSKKLERIRV